MDIKRCSEPGCEFGAECVCKCDYPWIFSCKHHAWKHIELPYKTHAFEFIYIDPYEGTKEAILGFLTKEKLENIKLKRNTLASFSRYLLKSEKYIKELIKNLDSSSDVIANFCLKIEQAKNISKPMQDPILELLSLQPNEAVEKVKMMIPINSDWHESSNLFCEFNGKSGNMIESFIKDKLETHADKRLSKIECMEEEHSKAITLTNSGSENILTSSDALFLFHRQNVKELIKLKTENKASLLNSQMNIIFDDLNNKSKETESVLNALRIKTTQILSRPNSPELEKDFRTTCSAIQTNSFDPPLMQAYQDYLNAYQQKTSLYNITKDEENRTNLIIYNTETDTQEVKIFQTPKSIDVGTCITQLPNGKLFCFGNYELSRTTGLIDVNGGIEVLPSGTCSNCPTCIYFNNSVYSFGGDNEKGLTLSSRFDFDRNRWIQLAPMPRADYRCNSIIFNRNILISGWYNTNLLLYSIDIDSFSTIPYEFKVYTRKILINAERLYLIECMQGSIYESEIGSYSNWRRIGKSKIDCNPDQVYCSYNKGGIYISNIQGTCKSYYYFNLDKKIIIDVAYYNTHVSLRRAGKKIEAIKWNNQIFKLDPYYLDEWSAKDISLKYVGENLKEIESYDEAIKLNPKKAYFYDKKGDAFYNLERYLEAIKCYDKAIKLNPNDPYFYYNKGNAFLSWQRYLEAIECYEKAIKLNPKDGNFYNNKGRVFYNLQRYLEAIECYDEAIKYLPLKAYIYNNNKGTALFDLERYLEAIECFDKAIECFDKAIECFDKAIKLNQTDADSYYKKGCSLNKLGRYPEAVKSYDEAIRCNRYNVKYYNIKGNTLYILERCQEAIQCYDEAIKLEPNNPLHFCCRARVFNNLRQEEAALEDFNTAYHLKQVSGIFTGNEWKLSEEDINFINDVLDRDRIELLLKMQI